MSFKGKHLTRALDSVWLDGTVLTAANAGTTGNVKVLMYDSDGDILIATGTDVPTDATDGYAKGCLFIDRDVATGSTGLYENVGTSSSCNFDQVGSNTTLAADAIDSDQIADDAVSLEHLDSGIAPHDIVFYAGDISWTSSGTTDSTNLSGTVTIASGDIVLGSISSAPTQSAYLVSCAASGNAITAELSAANTSNDAVVSYMILRSAT